MEIESYEQLPWIPSFNQVCTSCECITWRRMDTDPLKNKWKNVSALKMLLV